MMSRRCVREYEACNECLAEHLTVLPDINAQNGLVAGVASSHHEGVVLVRRRLNCQRAVLGHC